MNPAVCFGCRELHLPGFFDLWFPPRFSPWKARALERRMEGRKKAGYFSLFPGLFPAPVIWSQLHLGSLNYGSGSHWKTLISGL